MRSATQRTLAVLFWMAIAVTFALAMMTHPPDIADATNAEVQQAVEDVLTVNDKIQHLAVFASLAGLALAAWPMARARTIVLGLWGYGALIEFAQSLPIIGGDAELADWIADAVAVAAVVAAVTLYRRGRSRRSGDRASLSGDE